MEEAFINIWTEGEIFSSKNSSAIQWKYTPDADFITKDLAEEARSRRNRDRSRQDSGPNVSSPNTQDESISNSNQGRLALQDSPNPAGHRPGLDPTSSSHNILEGEAGQNGEEEEGHLADVRALLALNELFD